MKSNHGKESLIKCLLFIIFFGLGYTYEQPQGFRGLFLILIFLGFLGGQLFSHYKEDGRAKVLSFIYMTFMLLFMEHYTSFVMNYFFHFLYLILLIDALMRLPRIASWWIGCTITMVALQKYLYLYRYQKRPETLAEIIFFVLMTLIVFISCSFGRYFREEKDEKEKLYRQMLGANEALKLYSDKVERLTTEKERTRIARELHDRLGHQLTGLVMELEMIDYLVTGTGEEKKLITQAKEDARKTLTMVRSVVESFKDEKSECSESTFTQLLNEFKQRTFMKGILTNQFHNGTDAPWGILSEVLRESLTNVARHSQINEVKVLLTENENEWMMSIVNPGSYEEVAGYGNGIKGMISRVSEEGGTIETLCENGYKVLCKIKKGENR